MVRRFAILALAGLLAGCATTRGQQRAGPLRDVIEAATYMLGAERIRVQGRSYRSDCSGFVTAAFARAGVELITPGIGGVSGTESIYRSLKAEGNLRPSARIRPGDLLFFHNTWDRNKNGLRDDPFSHVGLVESIEDDGTITFFHFATGRVRRGAMNLRHPNEPRDPESGKTWNSAIRSGPGRVLTGQLFFRAGHPLEP